MPAPAPTLGRSLNTGRQLQVRMRGGGATGWGGTEATRREKREGESGEPSTSIGAARCVLATRRPVGLNTGAGAARSHARTQSTGCLALEAPDQGAGRGPGGRSDPVRARSKKAEKSAAHSRPHFGLPPPAATSLKKNALSPLQAARRAPRPAPATSATVALIKVRPYTVSPGDTLDSIAAKRGLAVDDLVTLNAGHVSAARPPTPGQALVLPAGKLSARDRDILAGITPGSGARFRPYPVRKGETAADIAAKRGISPAELAALNPGVDLGKLAANQVIKLPAGRYSVREREMLTGSAALPEAFFKGPLAGVPAGAAGAGALAAALIVVSILFRKARAGDA